MTRREVFDKYLPQLVLIMSNPMPALKLLYPYSKGLMMKEITKNLPDHLIPALFDIIKKSKFKSDPHSIMQSMNEDLRIIREGEELSDFWKENRPE